MNTFLVVTLSTRLFCFMAAFYGGLCFFGGCVWMATGKKNKNAEAQGYLYADEMHVERSQFEDNKPAWKKAK